MGNRLRSMLLLLQALAAGCGDDMAPVSGDADGGPEADAALPDAGELRTIHGVAVIRNVTPAGEVVVPIDLSGLVIEALAPPDFAPIAATMSEGAFEIAGVPAGRYWLRIGDFYLETDRDSTDLSYDLLGRPDSAIATTSPTSLQLDVDNLAAWQEGDDLQLFSAGSGTVALDMAPDALAGAPLAGDTALVGFTYDLAGRHLPDGDAGDRVILSQLALAADGERVYRRLVRAFQPEAFTLVDGSSVAVAGTFAAPEESETFAFAWDRPAFDSALRDGGAPDLGPFSSSLLALHTLPEAGERGFYSPSADLVLFDPGWAEDTSAIAGSWQHAPHPESWSRIVTARLVTYRFVGLPDSDSIPAYSYARVDLPRSQVSADAAIRPMVGPVTRPLVAGRSAYEPQDGVGTSPTLAWGPPAVGEPSAYDVVVWQLYDDGGATAPLFTARFRTRTAGLTIPSGILRSDGTYMFSITALATPGIDPEATPMTSRLPSGEAEIVTSPVTP